MLHPLLIITAVAVLMLGYFAWIVIASQAELKKHRTYHRKADENTKLALDFYDTVFNKKDMAGGLKFLDEDYIQHNPGIPTGKTAFERDIGYLIKQNPALKVEFKRTIAGNDLVAVHSLMRLDPGNPADKGSAVVDIFRVEYGKIMEHWDVIQPVPEKSYNNNSMF